MRIWLSLAIASAWSRRLALLIVVFSVSISVALILSVVQLRADARSSFSEAVSGVDLIVGPRGSPTELLMYTVFQLGRATRNMPADVEQRLSAVRGVSWVVPIQLGDTYRDYPVWGSRPELFERLKVRGRPVAFAQGRSFADPRSAGLQSVFELVLGAELATRFGHQLQDSLVLTHGAGGPLAQKHEQTPFRVVGILAPTGGPIDRAALVSLEGFEAMHLGWGLGEFQGLGGAFAPAHPLQSLGSIGELAPREITSLLVGLESRGQVFAVRRAIESTQGTPLMAVLPGVALDDLWRVLAVGENSLLLVGALVALSSVLSISAVLLVSISSRRREFAVLRAVGARPQGLLLMLVLESVFVSLAGMALGLCAHQLLIWASADRLRTLMGISLSPLSIPAEGWLSLAAVMLMAVLASLLPAVRAYRLSLQDGLNPPYA
ncbi:MAG: hypothetical protein RLY30_1648 [Pseudomonadota bacterium]